MCLAGDASQRCGGPVRGHSAYPQGLQMQPRRRGLGRPQGGTQGAIDTVSAGGRLSYALPVHHTPLDLWLRRTNALRRRGRAQPGRDQGRHQHHGERSQQHAGKPAVASRSRHATIVGAPRARQAAAWMARGHRRALPRPPANKRWSSCPNAVPGGTNKNAHCGVGVLCAASCFVWLRENFGL